MGEGEPVWVLVTEAEIGAEAEPTLADLSAALTRVYDTDFGVHSPTWISRFTATILLGLGIYTAVLAISG